MSSCGKGLTLYGFSDTWMKKTERSNLLADLLNKQAINSLTSIFDMKLIPLNKVWPDNRKEDHFRPIVVFSAVLKWLERKFIINSRAT